LIARMRQLLAEFLEIAEPELRAMPVHDRHRAFEVFVAEHVLRRFHVETLTPSELEAAHCGSTHDNQIDTLAILIDQTMVASPEQATALLEGSDDPRVSYVFVQTTTSTAFERQKMNNFVAGVVSFFSDQPFFPENPVITDRRRLKDAVRERLGESARSYEVVSLYFVSLGSWSGEPPADGTPSPLGWRRYAAEQVRPAAGHAMPTVTVLDARRLEDVVVQVRREQTTPDVYSRTIEAPHLLPLPALPGAVTGFVGFVRAHELIKLLEREDGLGLREQVSFHNVRVFLGMDNEVNAEIAQTVAGEDRHEFVLRNNGVTIIATGAQWTDGQLRLEQYQIVNGWQTSSVLYEQRDHVGPQSAVYVPLKVVVTEDDALKNAIVRSTNRQTAIGALEQTGQSPFARRLWADLRDRREAGIGEPMWLERRDGEFRDVPSVPEERVVGLRDLLAAATSMYRRQPHVAAQGPIALQAQVPKHLFADDHELLPYRVAARLLLRVRRYLVRNPELERFEHHLGYAVMRLVEPAPVPKNLRHPQSVEICQQIDVRLDQPHLVDRALVLASESIGAITRPINRSSARWRNLTRLKKELTAPLDRRLMALRKRMPKARD